MAEDKQKRRHGIPVGGVILLFLGIVFLLQTVHVIPWGLWGTLWRFWPVLLIAAGLGLLLRRYHPWLISLLILVVLFACLGLAIWQYGPSSSVNNILTRTYSQPLDNLEHAAINMDLAVGDITLGALDAGSPNLVETGFTERKTDTALKADFSRHGSEGTVTMKLDYVDWTWGPGESDWQAWFTTDIPLTMEIKCAVGNFDADFSRLNVTDLEIKLDVGNYKLTLPAATTDGRVKINAALSNTQVIVPDRAAARIRVQSSLCAVDIDQSRFTKQGDYYISSGYDSARNRLDIELDCDLGRVEIR